MFKFKRLLVIFKTNWKNVINETLPKGNSSILSQTYIDDIFTGIILIFISSLIYCIFNIKAISLAVSIIRLIICVALIIIINKGTKINSTTVFILFVIASLNMLASFIASIIYLPILFVNLIKALMFIFLNIVESIGFAFLVVTFIDFLKNARKEYDDDHYVERHEEIKLKTIDINDVSMHAIKICDNCNCKVIESDMFCSNCGKKLK